MENINKNGMDNKLLNGVAWGAFFVVLGIGWLTSIAYAIDVTAYIAVGVGIILVAINLCATLRRHKHKQVQSLHRINRSCTGRRRNNWLLTTPNTNSHRISGLVHSCRGLTESNEPKKTASIKITNGPPKVLFYFIEKQK